MPHTTLLYILAQRLVSLARSFFSSFALLQLEGCWLAMPELAPVILELIATMDERKRSQSPEQRHAEQARIAEGIALRSFSLCYLFSALMYVAAQSD